MRRATLALLAAVALVVGVVGLGIAATTTAHLKNGDNLNVTCPTTGVQSYTKANPYTGTVSCRKSPTPTPTTTAPTTAPTTVPTSPTTTPTSGTWACTVPLGDSCGPYQYADIPMSNGFNTYVSNQPLNVHGSEAIRANSPADWQVTANLSDCGGCVQTYASVQQLTQDWNPKADGTPAWGGGSGDADTPVNALASLKINYAETSPATGASYEFAADVWINDYAGINNPGGGDIMFWVDTHGRCDPGAFGPTLLGHITIDGQGWTVHRYGDYGDEIIAVLDGPGGPGTCAQQSSGSINVKAGLQAMQDNGWILARPGDDAHPLVDNLDGGWEITQSSGATFAVHAYSITTN
jgi:hypothetical protein